MAATAATASGYRGGGEALGIPTFEFGGAADVLLSLSLSIVSVLSFLALGRKTGTQMDDYDYVMHGKIFKIETSLSTDNQQKLYVSFGGLLMLLVGDAKPLEQFKLDTYVYLLLKKTGA